MLPRRELLSNIKNHISKTYLRKLSMKKVTHTHIIMLLSSSTFYTCDCYARILFIIDVILPHAGPLRVRNKPVFLGL